MILNNFIAASLTAVLLSTGISYAQTAPVDVQVIVKNEVVAQMDEVMALVEELKAEGYTYIEIGRTLLGRAKVMAEGPEGTREIVLSTATGEVMRDAIQDGARLAGNAHINGNMDANMSGGIGTGHGGGMGGGISVGMGGMSGN